MGGIIGFIIGAGIVLFLSNLFIFPADVLSMKFSAMTVGDFLRILAGLILAIIVGLFGGAIGAAIADD